MCMCTKPKPKTPKLQRERRKKNNNTDNNQNSGYIKTNSGEKETKTHKKIDAKYERKVHSRSFLLFLVFYILQFKVNNMCRTKATCVKASSTFSLIALVFSLFALYAPAVVCCKCLCHTKMGTNQERNCVVPFINKMPDDN